MARRLTRLILFFALTATASRAQSPAVPTQRVLPDDRPFSTRVSGIFENDLPQLDPPGAVKFILRPHLGDLIHRDYMRVETGLRWALREDFELSAEASSFFTHRRRSSTGSGIGKLRFGSRYVFERWPKLGYETTLALSMEAPVGHAPVDMTDGHNHLTPSIVIQHLWYSRPRLTTFAGMGLDLLADSSVPGTWGSNQPHDDSFSFTAGGVYDAGQLKWTLTTTYATTAFIGDRTKHFFYFQPGILWYVPRKYTFHSKTQWIFGLGAPTAFGPDGNDFSLSSRVRAEITFRQVMSSFRGHQSPPSR
ncbi:MAG TPA: hypothetical protein VKC51_11330 [Lacunisphaera sp.]|nr:hypothetical protein [Lacunisphaera sp.]